MMENQSTLDALEQAWLVLWLLHLGGQHCDRLRLEQIRPRRAGQFKRYRLIPQPAPQCPQPGIRPGHIKSDRKILP